MSDFSVTGWQKTGVQMCGFQICRWISECLYWGMKNALVLLMLMVGIKASAQPLGRAQETSLLNWLIEKDHVIYLHTKTNDEVFYKKQYNLPTGIVNASKYGGLQKTISDRLTEVELKAYKDAQMIMQTDWRYLKLKVDFTNNYSERTRKLIAKHQKVFTFSNPIFLNKAGTRTIIGEYVTCGVDCERAAMLLCEFKDGKWQLIARAIITND
jgi:hypothetical protein